MSPDLPKLRTLVAADHHVAQLISTAGLSRVRDGVTTVHNLAKKLHGYRFSDAERAKLLAACARLEQTGMGQLLEPSVRQRARFVWRIHPFTLSEALREKDFVLQPQHFLDPATVPDAPVPPDAPSAPDLPGEGAWQRQTFGLRPGVTIQLALPADLTAAEAERLAHLLRACVVSPGPSAQPGESGGLPG